MLKKIFKRLNLSGFLRDEDGNIAILAGFSALFLVLVVGVAIDTAEIYRARVNFQNALDAGTLMAAKVVASTGDVEKAKVAGTKVFNANLRNVDSTKGQIQFDISTGGCGGGPVVGNATLDHMVFFDGFHRIRGQSGMEDHVKLTGSTQVKCANDSIEIALVLDNSGSMRGSKINTLKIAATNLVNTLHTAMADNPKPNAIQFGVVPFSSSVNIGGRMRNQSWMDQNGVSPYHHENFDWSKNKDVKWNRSKNRWELKRTKEALSRFTLYDNLREPWGGCVETRPYPFNTTDDTPNESTPETMIVPMFAPDTPDNWTGQRNVRKWRGRWRNYRTISEETYFNSYLPDDHNYPTSNSAHPRSTANTGTSSGRQYKRQKWTWKYFTDKRGVNPRMQNTVTGASGAPTVLGLPGGPNFFCNSQAITDLTPNESAVENAISRMNANGATHIQQGAVWGWRLLSPDVPFDNGREYDDLDNRKIMIVMSDGNNTYYPVDYFSRWASTKNKSIYGAYGQTVNGRIFNGSDSTEHTVSSYTAAMDTHLAKTCTNAKGAGIQIYTIAFSVPANSSVKAMLEKCASADSAGAKLYYDANNNQALLDTFKDIADKLSELTVSK